MRMAGATWYAIIKQEELEAFAFKLFFMISVGKALDFFHVFALLYVHIRYGKPV